MKKKIAVLGATGHISKSLIYNLSRQKRYDLFLFARNLQKLKKFLKEINCENEHNVNTFNKFDSGKYDAIINCVGVGIPSKVKELGSEIFNLTESFDNMVIEYLNKHSKSIYIYLSSGAVYGSDFKMPVCDSTCSKWNIKNIGEGDYYGISKLNCEAKHRSLKKLNIVDLRIFNYFSRFIELDSKYLLTEIITCIKNEKEFITNRENIIRDFIHPEDLVALIQNFINKKNINDAFDVYSKKPIKKFEILNFFKKEYDLKYHVSNDISISSITGNKNSYYSKSRKAESIGYIPKYSSLDCIKYETKELM